MGFDFYRICSPVRCRMALLGWMRGPPSMNCCVKLLTEFHMHRAHQTAWRTRQCQGGGGRIPAAFLCEWSGEVGEVPMPCPQRRRIPSIICAVSPCSTPPCIAQRRERSPVTDAPPTPRNHHFAFNTSTHLTLPAWIPPSCRTCRVRDGSVGNAGRPSRGLTFSIIFMWRLAEKKVYVVSPLSLVSLLFFTLFALSVLCIPFLWSEIIPW